MKKEMINRKMGRPKMLRGDARITVHLQPEHLQTIDDVASADDCNRSEAVRTVIEFFEANR